MHPIGAPGAGKPLRAGQQQHQPPPSHDSAHAFEQGPPLGKG